MHTMAVVAGRPIPIPAVATGWDKWTVILDWLVSAAPGWG